MKTLKLFTLSAVFGVCAISSSAHSVMYNGTDVLLLPPSGQSLPSNCSFGRDRTNQSGDAEVSWDDVSDAYDAGSRLYNEGYEGLEWDDAETAKNLYDAIATWFSGRNYLRLRGGEYVVQGRPHRFTVNSQNYRANVRFHTNESGYVGTSRVNVEGRARLSLQFDREHGAGIVWAARSDMCSAVGVWVHHAPEVEVLSVSSSSIKLKYYVDNHFSRAVREGVDPSITIRQGNLTQTIWTPAIGVDRKASSNSRSVTIEKGDDGRYYGIISTWLSHLMDATKEFSVELNDGANSTSINYRPRVSRPTGDNVKRGCTWSTAASFGSGSTLVYRPIGECQYQYMEVTNGVANFR